MSTQRIEHTVQGYTYKRPKRAREDVDFPLGPEQSKKRQDDDADPRGYAHGRIISLLKQVPVNTRDSLSFSDVISHHEAIQAEWSREVGSDLAELGVNVGVPFRLMHDPAGAVTVAGDHPGREMIDSYFITNPNRVRELGDIIQFGRLASSAQDRLKPSERGQVLKTEAMAGWYSSNMNTATLLSGGGMVFGSGGTVYKGLDIRV